MHQHLPSLNALRAFEVAARHLSFKKAAEELHVTPGAISHQIKGLEEYLGVKLFKRLNHALALTPEGQAALPDLQRGFTLLAESMVEIRNHRPTSLLRVWAPPSLSVKWLVSRLHRFTADHPDIELQVNASLELMNGEQDPRELAEQLAQQEVDLAIWFGLGEWNDSRLQRLLAGTVVPLCSPRLLQGQHPLREPADLRHHRLIHDDTDYPGRPHWRDWLAAAGLKGMDSERGLHFNHVAMALDAASDGQGVVLTLQTLAQDELAEGQLVIPFGPELAMPHAYYLIQPRPGGRHVELFRNWLLEDAKSQQERVAAAETAPA